MSTIWKPIKFFGTIGWFPIRNPTHLPNYFVGFLYNPHVTKNPQKSINEKFCKISFFPNFSLEPDEQI